MSKTTPSFNLVSTLHNECKTSQEVLRCTESFTGLYINLMLFFDKYCLCIILNSVYHFTRFFLKNHFVRNLHVEGQTFKELILLKIKSRRNFATLVFLWLQTIMNWEACSIHLQTELTKFVYYTYIKCFLESFPALLTYKCLCFIIMTLNVQLKLRNRNFRYYDSTKEVRG